VGERPSGAPIRLRAEARNGVWALPTLGVPRRQAIRHAKSRKGYWRIANNTASGAAPDPM
ncbi:MAG: hypothetical protein KDA89_23080, partial [Planctomycetaceae bacterium]|nr:hypothetical protein [Planctomycetaceae bacterium]